MQVEPFLISSSVIGVVAQRLVRVICENCKEEYTPSEEVIEMMNKEIDIDKNLKLYRGQGCSICKNTGYFGRTSIFEIILLDQEIGSLIVSKASSNVIKETALRKGLKTLRRSGLEKALKGITTVEEVLRVAG